ncbi:MAG: NUDIX hydrolase [Saprospiraceae bacterium]
MIHLYSTEDKVLLAVDCIIFGFDGEDLKILLIKRDFEPEKGKWSLVGGFLKKDENLEHAAVRILNHYTGLDNIYMEQVATFSEVDRDPAERTISTAYYALINIQEHNDKLNKQFSANWFSISEAPSLIFDHSVMVSSAITLLRDRASTKPIGFELLPAKFTMRQLQNLYEAIWNLKIDKRNFINKINALGIVEKLNEKDKESSRKGSFLYQFNAASFDQSSGKQFILKF